MRGEFLLVHGTNVYVKLLNKMLPNEMYTSRFTVVLLFVCPSMRAIDWGQLKLVYSKNNGAAKRKAQFKSQRTGDDAKGHIYLGNGGCESSGQQSLTVGRNRNEN